MSASQDDGQGQELYFELYLKPETLRFVLHALGHYEKYRQDGIKYLREKWGENARTAFVEGERDKAVAAIKAIRDQCLLD